ncbi:hypothetical protein Mapa_010390 [Marchantia paleacea]|nr:hypothetical protein Mapa_010390 [Marchantia paleacea]
MLKFLKNVVGSAGGIKDLPYVIGEPYSSAWGSWTHYRGTSKEDNSPVSIFSMVANDAEDGRLAAARIGAKRLRAIRHPNILEFLHSTETETVVEGGVIKTTIYIVTEPVMPLAEKIKELNFKGTQRNEFYGWGLRQITKAITYLHSECALVHGNVCVDAVVVTRSLNWKLHAFDALSEIDGANSAASSPMLQYEWLVSPEYKPQEPAKANWATIRRASPWAIESWGLGCLIYEMFSGSKLTKTEDLRNTESIPKALLPAYNNLLADAPERRMDPARVIESSDFFKDKHDSSQFMAMGKEHVGAINLEEHQEVERVVRRRTEESGSELIPYLPDEVALLCLARVPRASHHVLSAVCLSWWNLLHDKVFYDVRQELAVAEEWLFLWTQDADRCNVWHGFDPATNKWFQLPHLPNEHRTAGSSASAVVDGKLFVIGGQLSSGCACNFVSYFDMRHYCWKQAAHLNVARAKCMAGVIGNQLYVVGGFTERDQNAGATAEAYDPVTNKWRLISSMKIPMELYDSAVLGDKFYVVNSSSENLVGLVYDPQKDEWVDMANGLNTGWQSKTAALNGKLYAVGDSHSSEGKNEISVYNAAKDVWESIKGVLDDTAPVLSWGPELVSLGGRLCIVGTSSKAHVAVVDINETSKPSVATLTYYEDITKKIQFAEPLPRGACQVLAL